MSKIFNEISSKIGQVDVVVGLDARGFLFGPILAQRLNCAFVPVRKSGKVQSTVCECLQFKLPGKVESLASTKEYGKDVLEIQVLFVVSSLTLG